MILLFLFFESFAEMLSDFIHITITKSAGIWCPPTIFNIKLVFILKMVEIFFTFYYIYIKTLSLIYSFIPPQNFTFYYIYIKTVAL